MNTTSKQAQRVIEKFEGVASLQSALATAGHHVTRATIYRWTYPPEKGGCDGYIPSRWIDKIKKAAFLEDITLSDQDLAP